jgi:hypothetical protein
MTLQLSLWLLLWILLGFSQQMGSYIFVKGLQINVPVERLGRSSA